MKTDFKNTVTGRDGDKTMPSNTGPVSKIEKERLEIARETPIPTFKLTPGGTVEQETHQHIANQREDRINYIIQRLKNAREEKQLKRNFNRDIER